MTFGEAVKSGFKKYCVFSGRARRSEYWWFVLFNIIVQCVFLLINCFIPREFGIYTVFNYIRTLYGLAVFLPGLGLCWRRLHDIGKCGAWFFINFVPIVGQIILIFWLSLDSQPGENKYGPNPKGIESDDEMIHEE